MLACRIGSINVVEMSSTGVTQSRMFAGAMSGTSADGVDVVIARIEGSGLSMSAEVVSFESVAYDKSLRRMIFDARSCGSIRLDELARLGRSITLIYAQAIRRAMKSASVSPTDLVAIGAHGQTLFHNPPDSIQWIDPSLLAHETGVAVVSDFRRADLAVGGQGAPLVPFADYVLFRSATHDVVTLNIGGIANVTWLPRGCSIDEVIAFDSGPGNCVSDWLCRTFDPHGPGYDENGTIAESGKVIDSIVDECLHDPYFSRPYPKSTDGPSMISIFDRAWKSLAPDASFSDLLATAIRFTVRTVFDAMLAMPAMRDATNHKAYWCAGGGFENRFLGAELLKWILIENGFGWEPCMTNERHIDIMAREALAFAILAAATMDGVPANVPSATGAKQRVVLGSITPKPHPSLSNEHTGGG